MLVYVHEVTSMGFGLARSYSSNSNYRSRMYRPVSGFGNNIGHELYGAANNTFIGPYTSPSIPNISPKTISNNLFDDPGSIIS